MDRPIRVKRAIQSVLEQSYERIEIAVVDDSEGNETRDVIQRFESKTDIEITYIRNDKPQGLPKARNQGVKQTDSKYLAFLDDDDEWDTAKIKEQVNLLESTPSEYPICYTGHRTIWPDGSKSTSRYDTRGDVFEKLLVSNELGMPSTIMISRNVFDEVGGFNEKMSGQEDWEFYLRIAQKYNFECISEPLITRHIHDGIMSSDHDIQKKGRKNVLEEFCDEIEKRGLASEAWANYHRTNGLAYCSEGQVKKGRSELRQSLAYEFDQTAFVNFIAAMFGPTGYKILSRLKNVVF